MEGSPFTMYVKSPWCTLKISYNFVCQLYLSKSEIKKWDLMIEKAQLLCWQDRIFKIEIILEILGNISFGTALK